MLCVAFNGTQILAWRCSFERPFTPRGWLRSASNFGKTRFRWSPTFHFSAAQTFFATKIVVAKTFFVNGPKIFSAKCLFWSSCAGLHTNVECSSRIHCQNYRFQPSTTLGGGVKRQKTVFIVSFGLKKLIPTSFLEILFTFVCESQARVPHVNKAIAGITVTALIVFRINKGKHFFT